MGGSKALEQWRAAMVADGHGIPAVVVRDGRVHEANDAARSFFGKIEPAMAFEELFDENSRDRVRAFLRMGRSGRSTDAEVAQQDRPPVPARILLLETPGEQLVLVGTLGIEFDESASEKLMAATAQLTDLARKLAKARAAEARARAELEELGRASRLIADAVAELPQSDISAVTLMIALQAQLLTHADYVALGIGLDPEKSFKPWVFLGVPQAVAESIGRFPRPVGVLGRVARNGEVIRAADVRHHPYFGGVPPDHFEMRSFLGVPIRFRGRPVGNLFLANRPGGAEFTQHDERLIRMLAARVAAAIETASAFVMTSRQREWLQSVIDQMPDGVLLYDDKGQLRAANHGVSELACEESDRTDPYGNPLVVDPRRLDGTPLPSDRWPHFRALHDHEVLVREEMIVRSSTGDLTPVAVSAGPVRSPTGETSGAMVIIQDISDHKELERLREEWAAVIAHDLRQPVTTISLAAAAILRRHLPELSGTDRRALEKIGAASKRLGRMINDLIDASLVESKRLTIDPRPVELGAFIRSIVAELGDSTDGHEVRLTIGSDQTAWIDRDRIHQVFANLLSNAVKYGSADTAIQIEAIPRDDQVEVIVTNHGPGIPPDELPFLFSRFTRARETDGRPPGIGLGLYIATGLVEAHGGRLWADSTPGDTTSFHFTLPTTPPLPKRRGDASSSSRPPA